MMPGNVRSPARYSDLADFSIVANRYITRENRIEPLYPYQYHFRGGWPSNNFCPANFDTSFPSRGVHISRACPPSRLNRLTSPALPGSHVGFGCSAHNPIPVRCPPVMFVGLQTHKASFLFRIHQTNFALWIVIMGCTFCEYCVYIYI